MMPNKLLATNALRMQAAQVPPDESDRLEALRALQLLDSDPSETYDRITGFVAHALDMPIVLVSLVDANRQWFKSRVGLEATETPRDISFCGHVVFDREPLIIPDATLDARFADNPLVTGEPHVRAYIGVPLLTHGGHAIGTLCAIDSQPRQFESGDLKALTTYAKILEESIHAQELARASDEVLKLANERERLFRDTFNQAAVGITHATPSGQLLRVNQRCCDMLGYSETELHGISFSDITHPDDQAEEKAAFQRMLAGDLDSFRLEKRIRCKNGNYLWTEISVAFKKGAYPAPNYVIAVIVDIAARKRADEELLKIRDSLRQQVNQQTAKLQESNKVLQLQVEKVVESEGSAREAMSELQHFHYALDQHASVAVTDLAGVITYANHRFCDLSGYSQAELVGSTHRIVKSGIHSQSVFEDLWRTILAGSVWHGELCNQKKTGERYWVDASIVPYKDETGRIIRFVSIRIDITQRKRDQELLHAAETRSRQINERLRQITDSMPAMIAYWDRAGVCRFANRAHFDRYGLTSKEIVGMSIENLFGAAFDEGARARVNAALEGQRQLFDHSAPTADGSLRHWHSDYVPHWQDSRVVGFYALIVDITDRQNAEEKLIRQEALLAATGRMGGIGGWELQRDALGPVWSEVVSQIHEVPPGQHPTFDQMLHFYPPESRTAVAEAINAAFYKGKSFDFVVPLVTATGLARWVRSIGEPQIANGEVHRIVGALQDVTQQRQLEADLAQAQKLESIGQLSAGIAHEINTPTQFIGNNIGFIKDSISEVFALTTLISQIVEESHGGVINAAQLVDALHTLDLPYLQDEVPRAIGQSVEGIERIQRIVSAMKEFSHPVIDKTLLDLNRAIASTIIVASNEWKYVADVKTDFDNDLPHVSVMPGSFNQVILNMIVNASHAVCDSSKAKDSKGTITLSTRRVDGWAEIRIQDTGCGIPEKIRGRIFDPFFTTKPVGKGTGQGLAIAHDVIVKKHGGTIRVDSELGVGTTFILCLPIPEESSNAVVAA